MEDLDLLLRCGEALDCEMPARGEEHPRLRLTVRDFLIESLLKVRSKTRGLVPLRRNRAQQEYSRRCSRRNLVLKARQLGITTYIAARFFIQTITQPGTLSVQVAHTQESAEEIFRIVHRFWENLPEGMQHGALLRSRANIRQIAFPRLDSEYRVATAADPNAGRGMTIHHLHGSEVARWPRDGAETLASLRSAVPRPGEVVLESTPNGASGIFYEEWQRAEETGHTQHFFPWWYEDLYTLEDARVEVLTLEEQELATKFGLRPGQIAWRRENRAQLRGLAAQEFAEDAVSCFLASGESVFDLPAIEQALAHAVAPLQCSDNGRWLVWFPPQPGKQYIVGVDPAGGGATGDYSCAQVIEQQSGLQCAELHGHFPPQELATRVMALAELYHHGLLAVERNNHGHAVLAHLRMRGWQNIFREGEQDGWLTSAISRPAMLENLAAALSTSPELFPGARFLSECRTFVRNADGSSGAAYGTHDDCVMAMAIAWAARQKLGHAAARTQTMELASLPSQLSELGIRNQK
jgi:hypothetical protein